jgi:hypothetical protein
MQTEDPPKWIKTVITVCAVLAGFNILSGFVDACFLFVIPRLLPESDVEGLFTTAVFAALGTGVVGAALCPLLLLRKLKGRSKKVHALTLLILVVMAALPLPQPVLFVSN